MNNTLINHVLERFPNIKTEDEVISLVLNGNDLKELLKAHTIRVTCCAIAFEAYASDVLMIKPDAEFEQDQLIASSSDTYSIFLQLYKMRKIIGISEINPFPEEITIHAYGDSLYSAIDSVPNRNDDIYLDAVEGEVYVKIYADLSEEQTIDFIMELLEQKNISGAFDLCKRPAGYPENCFFDVIINPYEGLYGD